VSDVEERHVPVLVVGGSLVGLTTSVLLADQGVPHLLVESHRGTAIHPRAASFHQRTMEVFRSAGLQQAVEEAAAGEFLQNGAIMAVESLGGKELAYFFHSYNDGVEGLSPTDRLFVTQVGLEPVLRERAVALGAEHRFGTELVSFEQHDDHVRSVIRSRDDDSEEEVVVSDYLVAADGAHSRIREQLGIAMSGRGSFADCVTIYFKADVKPFLGDRNLSVVYVNHPTLLGFFRFSIAGDSGFLAVFSTTAVDGTRDTSVGEDMPIERSVELVRTALGADDDLPVDIESVQRWSASAATAQAFSHGRVFLAGDSAHVMPPTGGFGGNTGVADAHNLAWKLALVTKGLAGPGLLASYDEERRPIGALTVEQAYTRYVLRVDPSLPQDDLQPALDDASIELGAVYRSGAVAETSAPETPLADPRERTWAPGTRAPHVGLADGRSTVDVPGHGFALLVDGVPEDWVKVADEASASVGVPVNVQQVEPGDSGLQGAALLRPDGVVAWRTSESATAAGLDAAMATLLDRRPPA
jgi:2-polyprenyl-6-methoxyphenol hydroxylase-like FAD-dependent oxidoreductase